MCIIVYKLSYITQHRTTPPDIRFRPFFQDNLGEPVPEENFRTVWCKGRLTQADTLTIPLGPTPSWLTSAHLHHPPIFYRPDALPAAQPKVSKHWRQNTAQNSSDNFLSYPNVYWGGVPYKGNTKYGHYGIPGDDETLYNDGWIRNQRKKWWHGVKDNTNSSGLSQDDTNGISGTKIKW